MSEIARPRGLGRGLSALLGEPVRTEAPRPALGQAQPERAPIEPPRNVFELPITNAQQPQAVAPEPVAPVVSEPVAPPVAVAPVTEASAPAQVGSDVGPRSIPIDLVQRNPQQPRKHFDEADLSELASSIKTHGVLQPILVRPIADGRFEIVAGERRWRAAQRAGLHTIPAVIRELNEVEVLEIAIVENVQRADLNPIEEAQGFQALIDRFGRTQEEIADAVGIKAEVAAITARAMNGELDFHEALRTRVALVKGLERKVLEEIRRERITLASGGRALVQTMKAYGAYTSLVSGGFTYFADYYAKRIGFDEAIANVLEFDGEKLTGTVADPIVDKTTKLTRLQALALEQSVPMSMTLAVGDGANDLDMIKAAGMGVALHAKPVVAEQAGVRIDHGDLTALLYLQGFEEDDFVR